MAFLHCVLVYVSLICQGLHVLARDNNISNTGFSLTARQRSRCVEKNDSINITCELVMQTKVNNAKVDWNILWQSEGEIIDQNYSIIHQNNASFISSLSIYVSWVGAKVFTCFTTFKRGILSKQIVNLNTSVAISTLPQQTAINGARFIEGNDGIKILEIYWTQLDSNDTYSLQHSIEDNDSEPGDKPYDQIECSYRLYDVYRVPNTTGHICKGSIKGQSFPAYTEHRLNLITIRGQCQSTGPIKKYDLQYYGNDTGPNKYELLLIPHRVVNFAVRVARQRQVHVTWKTLPNFMDAFRREYLLKYNCSEEKVNKRKLKKKTNITLHSADFSTYRPHALCKFCIQACLPDFDVYSEPVCAKARLHEERPSEPPEITCSGNECATTVSGQYRNVTVTWDLPPRETWNGNLTYFVVYCRARNGSTHLNITERINLSRRFVVLPRLAENSSYDVEMAICNKEGCSPFGNTVISREIETNSDADKSPTSQDATTSIVQATSIAIVVAAILIILVVAAKLMRKRCKEKERLPKIHEPIDYDNICGEQETTTEYDLIVSDEKTEHGEDNMAQDNNTETSA